MAASTIGRPTGTTRTRFGQQRRWATAAAAAAAFILTLAACTSAPQAAAPGSSPAPASTSASAPVAADARTVDITMSGGNVTPNGEKIDVRVGQQVVLKVTSDEDDQIHAHTGGDGYELEVKADVPATGTFTIESAGSFEVESHHLEKVIVILNAR